MFRSDVRMLEISCFVQGHLEDLLCLRVGRKLANGHGVEAALHLLFHLEPDLFEIYTHALEDVGRNPGRVKTRIQKGADDLGAPGVDPYYGKGRINVANTVR